MKADKIYQELKILAEKLRIKVLEKNFKPAGIKVRSGSCKIKNEDYCLVDKHLKMQQKVDVLAQALSKLPHEREDVIPAVRDILNRYKKDGDDPANENIIPSPNPAGDTIDESKNERKFN